MGRDRARDEDLVCAAAPPRRATPPPDSARADASAPGVSAVAGVDAAGAAGSAGRDGAARTPGAYPTARRPARMRSETLSEQAAELERALKHVKARLNALRREKNQGEAEGENEDE